ncbi:MAG: helix-turn-helix transcriptional regulator [Verrucomicrobiales bacterium]|nr:helix-turn-helix transcriptional regulator [Verrucomicrobiales bacterium]
MNRFIRIYPRPNSTFEAFFEPSFSSVLKNAREREGIGLRELAKRVNCSHAYLNLIEGGERKPAPKLLSKLQGELGIEPFFLVSEAELTGLHLEREDIAQLEQTPQSVSYILGLLHTALREGGFDSIPGVPSENERDQGVIACFNLGSEETYEVLIRQKNKRAISAKHDFELFDKS